MSHLQTQRPYAMRPKETVRERASERGQYKSKQLLCKAVRRLVQPKAVNRATHLAVRNKSPF